MTRTALSKKHASKGTLVIGITGGMASGKSTVAKLFSSSTISHIDADAIVHDLMQNHAATIKDLAAAFPGAVSGKTVDRSALAAIITKHPTKLKTLEKLLHPRVRDAEEKAIKDARARGDKAILLDIPLLFETDAQTLCDKVIVVHAPITHRRKRAFARPGMTEAKWDRLFSRQLPDHERLPRADAIIHTSRGLDATKRAVAKLKKQWGI